MPGAVTLTPTLNQASFGTGVFGTAKYGQYIVTLKDGVNAANSTSPEFGLTENFQYAPNDTITNQQDAFTSTTRNQNVVLAGELTLPSSFSGNAECIWELGGTGIGAWLGIAKISGVYHLRFRAGEGDTSVQDNTAGDVALANVAISNIPEFDGNTHTMVWEMQPRAPGRIRLWIDGRNIIDQETSGGDRLEGGSYAGSAAGGWGKGNGAVAGGDSIDGTTQFQANTTFSGTIQSNLRVYNNQTVGSLTPLAQPNVTEVLTSVSATGAVETVAVNGFEIDISERISTGVAGTGQIGTPNAFIKVSIVGVSATGQIGTLEHSNTVTLSGVVGTTNTPSLEPKVSEDIVTGVEGTGQVGSVTVNPGAGLAGVSATGGIGTLEHSNTVGLTGVVGTTNTPSVEPKTTDKVSGVSATGQVGSVRQNPGAGLTGVVGTGQIGTTTQTAIVFDFEAVRDQFSSKRMVYIPRAA